MKKWLLMLLMLAAATPAVADVFIYNYKITYWGYESEAGEWEQYKGTDSAYMIFEPNSEDETKANLVFIDVWKEKDDEGVMRNYYEVSEVITAELMKAQVGKKLMWILYCTGEGDNDVMAGQAATKKIGGVNYSVAAKLTGYATWYTNAGGNIDTGGGTDILTLNTKLTTSWRTSSLEDAKDALIAYLEDMGYELEL